MDKGEETAKEPVKKQGKITRCQGGLGHLGLIEGGLNFSAARVITIFPPLAPSFSSLAGKRNLVFLIVVINVLAFNSIRKTIIFGC
jgi:hypothetical protein